MGPQTSKIEGQGRYPIGPCDGVPPWVGRKINSNLLLWHLGCLGGVLGASWGHLGGVLGWLWIVLGRLGASWGRLGGILGRLGGVLRGSESFLGRLVSVLEASWSVLLVILSYAIFHIIFVRFFDALLLLKIKLRTVDIH